MKTQTKVKEEILKEFEEKWWQHFNATEIAYAWDDIVKPFLSQSLDRLEKSVREEIARDILTIIENYKRERHGEVEAYHMGIGSAQLDIEDLVSEKYHIRNKHKLTSQKEEHSHPQGEAYCETCLQQKGWQKEEEQKVPCKFSACHEFVSLHDTYCKKHMYLRIKEDK